MKIAYRFTVDSDHPSLPGHFPGAPVVPGVVIIDEVWAHVQRSFPGRALIGVRDVKFTNPLRPGELVEVVLQETGSNVLFQCTSSTGLIASGTLNLVGATGI